MPRLPHPRRAEALAYLVEHPGDLAGAAALIGVTPDAVRRWIPPEQRRGRGQRGPDKGQREAERAELIAGALASNPGASTDAIGEALGVSGQRVRKVRRAYLSDGE